MLQSVDDTAYRPHRLLNKGWPEKWQPWTAPVATDTPEPSGSSEPPQPSDDGFNASARAGWTLPKDGDAPWLASTEGNDSPQWLRFRQFLPSGYAWAAAATSAPFDGPAAPKAGLIADLSDYNNAVTIGVNNVPAYRDELMMARAQGINPVLAQLAPAGRAAWDATLERIYQNEGLTTISKDATEEEKREWEDLVAHQLMTRGPGWFEDGRPEYREQRQELWNRLRSFQQSREGAKTYWGLSPVEGLENEWENLVFSSGIGVPGGRSPLGR